MTFSLIELEDQYIVKSNNLAKHRPGLYPSEASVEYPVEDRMLVYGKCLRAAWYRSMNIYKPGARKPGLTMKGVLGKGVEREAIERWKQMGLWVDNNVKFYNKELALSGELDCVIKDPENKNNLIGIECKSYYSYYPNKTITGAKIPPIPGKPIIDHYLQSLVYAWEYREQLSEYRIYYQERGDGHRVSFLVGTEQTPDGLNRCWWEQIPGPYWNKFSAGRVYQPYTIEDIHNRYRRLIKHLKNRTLPPKDYEKVWDIETTKFMYRHGEISKTKKYEAWEKKPKSGVYGSFWCNGYCDWIQQCEQDSLTE